MAAPVKSQLPGAETADIRQQIQVLREALDQRLAALESSRQRLARAKSLLERLNNEYQSFELRLEKAGLNLTAEYARLLRQRLDRLESQTIAAGLTQGIAEQLSAAREEQLRLEEYGAIASPEATARGQMNQKRLELIEQLHSAVTKHIQVLNDYYSTVIQLRERFYAYQELLQQRLFWLPSTDPVSIDMFSNLYRSAAWFLSGFEWAALVEAVKRSASERRLAEAREAAESSGEGVPVSVEMPEMNLKDISQQSETLLKILAVVLAAAVLWMFWADVIPALRVFDNVTLWGDEALPTTLGDLMVALLFFAGTIVAVRNLPGTLEVMVLSRLNLEPGAGYAITTMATYIIVFIGIAAALAAIGLQWSKLQWLVAALGVGLGFGLQEIVANFVSGIILLFERPIRVGDTVSISGTTGTVSRIRIRATTLVDWDRKEQIIPNKTFVTEDLTNWTLSDPINRVIIRVGVAYGSDVDKVRDLLHDVAINNERVLHDPAPAVFCVGFGDSSVDFEVRVFIKDLLDFMPLSHELHSAITDSLRDADIHIPFPQRDIHIRTSAAPWNPEAAGEQS